MTPAEQAMRDAWLAELWPTCREVPREERAVDQALRSSTDVYFPVHKSPGRKARKTPRKRRRMVDTGPGQKVDPGSDSSQLSEESRGLATPTGRCD